MLTTVPVVPFLVPVAVITLVLVLALAFVSGGVALTLLTLAAVTESSDLHRHRPLEEFIVSKVSTHRHCVAVPEEVIEASILLHPARVP